MKIGICSSAANYFSTWDERFSHLRSLGYEAVDHSLENINLDYYKNVEAMKDHCKQVREAAEKNGLIISQGGKTVYRQNGKKIVSDKDHALIIPHGASYESECTESGRFTVINFLLNESSENKDILSFRVMQSTALNSLCSRFSELSRLEDTQSELKRFSVFYEMVSVISEHNNTTGITPIITKAKKYVHNHFDDPSLVCQSISR